MMQETAEKATFSKEQPMVFVSQSLNQSSTDIEDGVTGVSVDQYSTKRLDDLRSSEYGYLDEQDHVYLDYTGAGLASRSQYKSHQLRLSQGTFGNPHSVSPTSLAATELVEQTRDSVLSFLNASAKEYAVIFTPNATGAARLVGESYPFKRGSRLVLTSDNHNSINGLREFAGRQGSKTTYVRTQLPDLRVEEDDFTDALRTGFSFSCFSRSQKRSGLFAFPAQSNFSGVRHPLHWVSKAQERGYDVLLDAAAYLPTSTLDLSVVKPEFVIMSWYKVFGFPTGVGCLVAKQSAMARLNRPWFSGGTVQAASTGMPWHQKTSDESAFEDGTVNFLSIPDVKVGIDWINSVGMPAIQTRVYYLTAQFLDRLINLRHSNGSPMAIIYGPKDMRGRGGTVAFNLLDAEGRVVDERLVALEASAARISLRTGCFCNPGVGEDVFQLDLKALRRLPAAMTTSSLDDYIKLLGLPSMGAIRVSFGVASNMRDLERCFEFLTKTYRDRVTSSKDLPAREKC